ncbi:MAG: hypothetical protein K6B41_02160 [Butyrivibrio sp.]|nr:hypothetical protein [Butyrivibrio sp.]
MITISSIDGLNNMTIGLSPAYRFKKQEPEEGIFDNILKGEQHKLDIDIMDSKE